MNVLLISQCSKRALSETRHILDQFAERRGDRTWQTPITRDGLQTLHKMLRKTARKNTAVSCHWIRGNDHSELLWIVGDARQFNAQGATPTNTTQRDVLRSRDENDWHSGEDIRLIASLAGLLHDLGKANAAFQKKLQSRGPLADAYRHEWVSLRLFEAFVGGSSDEAWLQRLVELTPEKMQSWLNELKSDCLGKLQRGPFRTFDNKAPLASLIGWLIVSHHRVPAPIGNDHPSLEQLGELPRSIAANWCGEREASEQERAACWSFKKGLPFGSKHWCEHACKLAKGILQRPQLLTTDWFENPYVEHLSRMTLMLADHYYSAQESNSRYGDADFPLIANTCLRDGDIAANQRLDEHLIGVEVNASRIMQALPRMGRQLPRIARHKGFSQRSKISRFRWQDKAFDLASGLQTKSGEQGFFGINMASTGCGKTLANGRIMYGLADPQQGARFNIALGLRTLTLQTGDAYRARLGLGDEDMAVQVGGGPVRELFEKQKALDRQESALAQRGAESSEGLIPESNYVHFEGSLEDGPLNKWLGSNHDAQKLLKAPILTCTIDHLMPATESTRGGHQIAPMLRLMSSDLVLDEPDDFALEDLPALTRLVHWAGMLGSRVLLSSATLPPALVQGLFQAYLAGRSVFQKNRGEHGLTVNVCCAWFDEFTTQNTSSDAVYNYLQAHLQFVEKRQIQLANATQQEQRRKAVIKPLGIPLGQTRPEICQALAAELHHHLHTLHATHHTPDPNTGKRVSLGLIRMANINPLVQVAQALYTLGGQNDCHIHLCVYHAQHPLLVRSAIEKKLDKLLNRNEGHDIFADAELRQILDHLKKQKHLFVILASQVAEVGRDHDYDWAIVEPSSMRSIIQLAGRVRRHRQDTVDNPNIYLLDTNVRHLEHGLGWPAFCRPGFENNHFKLDSHRLTALLTPEQLAVIDASSRIREREPLNPKQNLVDLEHASLRDLMLGANEGQTQVRSVVTQWWQTRVNLSAYLQRWDKQPFRHDPQGRQRYALLLDDDGQVEFCQMLSDGVVNHANNLLHCMDLTQGSRISFWGAPDYLAAVSELAEFLNQDEAACARRYGYIDLPENKNGKGWSYDQALGFSGN